VTVWGFMGRLLLAGLLLLGVAIVAVVVLVIIGASHKDDPYVPSPPIHCRPPLTDTCGIH
jgi:hypothetical protein